MQLTPGSHVERYIVEYPLGQGGMATVYAVRHALLGSRHALKVLQSTNPRMHERLIQEGRVQALLDPEHVVPVQDVLIVGGAPALLMPLVQGCSLQELLEAYRPTTTEAAALFEGILIGVAAAHEAGIVHRDLKPGNVLLDEKRGRVRVRVADFGLARMNDDPLKTRAGAVMGTPAYAAPEQMRDASSADHRADMWSLGVLLVELLTGHRPNPTHDTPQDSLAGMPLAWRALVDALLVPDPAGRWGSATELLERVRRVVVPDRLASHGPLAEAVRQQQAQRVPAATTPAHEVDVRTLDIAASDLSQRSRQLPPERDRFFGRQDAIAQLRDQLKQERLITVTGTGGAGKTRLVTRYARGDESSWSGGVWFCDLSEARTEEGVLHAVAHALDVPLGPDPRNQLAHAIASRGQCLVALDTFEHVLPFAEATVGAWLDAAPKAHFIVTSRQRLGIPGERVMALSPLAAPEAEALFTERAAQARPGFVPTDPERDAIQQLVALLDHLPLAIELAAARVRIFPPTKLLARMSDRFRLLADVSTSRSDRHATLRSTLDWSWDLLDAFEQATLAQLSVFDGGFDLEAAEFVVDLSSVERAPWAIDAVQSLLEKSLVRRVSDERFELLRSVRDYASEKLDLRAAPEGRHVDYYARWGSDEALDALRGPDGIAEQRSHGQELDNLIIASRRAIALGLATQAVATCRAAWWHLELRGPLAAGQTMAEAVLGLAELTPRERALMLLVVSSVGRHTAQPEAARRCADEALALARGAHAKRVEAEALAERGELSASMGHLKEATEDFHRAIEAHQAADDPHGEARACGRLHMCLLRQGQADPAFAHLERSLTLARSLGDRHQEAVALVSVGVHRLTAGHPDEAKARYLEALEVFRQVGAQFKQAQLHSNLGVLFVRAGDLTKGEAAYRDSLALARRLGERQLECLVLLNLGEVYLAREDVNQAQQHFRQALLVQRGVKDSRVEVELQHHLGRLASEAGDLGAGELLTHALGLARASGDLGAQGRILGSFAEHAWRQGRRDDARAFFDQGESLLRDVGDPEPLAGLLCQRVPMEVACGLAASGQSALDEARALATAADLLDEPFFASRLAHAQRALHSEPTSAG